MACFCMIIMVWSYNSTHSGMSDVDQGFAFEGARYEKLAWL